MSDEIRKKNIAATWEEIEKLRALAQRAGDVGFINEQIINFMKDVIDNKLTTRMAKYLSVRLLNGEGKDGV